MIDKTIHYCWFGGKPKPRVVEKCIASWKKYCPEYSIIEWNEKNFDVNKLQYTKEAYEHKKYAFVSDYARLEIVYFHGGIYLDTDVELINTLDSLLNCKSFFSADGYGVNSGQGFGAERNNDIIKSMIDVYNQKRFVVDGNFDLTPCTAINTKIFLENGYDIHSTEIVEIVGATILPPDFFDPICGETSELRITERTLGIHWGTRFWETGTTGIKARLRIMFGNKFVFTVKSVRNKLLKLIKSSKDV